MRELTADSPQFLFDLRSFLFEMASFLFDLRSFLFEIALFLFDLRSFLFEIALFLFDLPSFLFHPSFLIPDLCKTLLNTLVPIAANPTKPLSIGAEELSNPIQKIVRSAVVPTFSTFDLMKTP